MKKLIFEYNAPAKPTFEEAAYVYETDSAD